MTIEERNAVRQKIAAKAEITGVIFSAPGIRSMLNEYAEEARASAKKAEQANAIQSEEERESKKRELTVQLAGVAQRLIARIIKEAPDELDLLASLDTGKSIDELYALDEDELQTVYTRVFSEDILNFFMQKRRSDDPR